MLAIRRFSALLVIAAAGAPAQASAGATVTDILRRDVASAPTMRVTAERVRYAPGQASSAHRHGGFLIAYVLRGEVVSQIEGEPARTYRAGESWFEDPGAHHLVCRNASPTEPAEFLVVYVTPKTADLATADSKPR